MSSTYFVSSVDNHEAFVHKVRYTPYSREIFKENQAKLETETDPLERAVAWWCVRVMSYGGMGGGFDCHRSVNGKVMVSGYQHAVYDQLGSWQVQTLAEARLKTVGMYPVISMLYDQLGWQRHEWDEYR